MTQAPAQQWWQQAQQAYQEQDWSRLEGCLRRMLELVAPQPELFDLLGHALLQQGRYQDANQALQHALELGARHFWTPHKLGDAQRGLQRLPAAVQAYEQALLCGSDSLFTTRNLLEVLHQIHPHQALGRLERFAPTSDELPWQSQPPWLQGALAAALRVQGCELARWLCQRGCPNPLVRAVLWSDAAYRLDLASVCELLAMPCSAQEDVLAQRIRTLCP
jgi:tetratricopeptide (TPR) repeat protein